MKESTNDALTTPAWEYWNALIQASVWCDFAKTITHSYHEEGNTISLVEAMKASIQSMDMGISDAVSVKQVFEAAIHVLDSKIEGGQP